MTNRRNPQSGVALIMVIFIVTLASILVVNLAYSTYLNSRISAGAQRSIQAEYLMKSSLSLAQVLLDISNPQYDSANDLWAQFYDGMPIPVEYLGINEPNLSLRLEIRPADAGLCVKNLISPDGTGNTTWYRVFERFFGLAQFNFDNDTDQTDESGRFPKKHFTAAELAASLIEYQDADSTDYQFNGYEANMPPKNPLKNAFIKSFSEFSQVPGMTAHRLSQILPHLTYYGSNEININLASGVKNLETVVLEALDTRINASVVDEIHKIALSNNPYNSGSDPRLQGLLTPSSAQDIKWTARSTYFHVVAEADYGTSHFFLRAVLQRDHNASPVPKVESFEIF